MCACSKKEDTAQTSIQTTIFENTDNILDLCIYETDTLNPLKTSVKQNAEVLSLLYDSLFDITSNFSAIYNVAKNITLSSDGLIYAIEIQNDIHFTDGTPLTAEDVVASINTIVASSGYFKSRLSMITHASCKRNIVYIHVSRPVANFKMLLDFPILPKTCAEEKESDMPLHVYQGSGLYTLSNYLLNKEIHLKVNKNHYSGTLPQIESIIIHIATNRETAMHMLEIGEIDMLVENDLSRIPPHRKLEYNQYNACNFVYIGMQAKETYINTPITRSAISAALKRQALLESINTNAVPTLFPVHPHAEIIQTDMAFSQNQPTYADGILLADGWTDVDNNGILEKQINGQYYSLSFTLCVNRDAPQKVFLAEQIKKNLLNFGIEIKISALPFSEYKNTILSETYDLYLGETTLLPNFDLKDVLSLSLQNEMPDSLIEAIKEAQFSCDDTTLKKINQTILHTYSTFLPLTGLYFENDVLLCDSSIDTEKITTLNPYKSIMYWAFKNPR